MPKKAVEDDVPESASFAERVVGKIRQDKTLQKIVKLGDEDLNSDTPYYIPTGVPTLDYAIGRPGIPAGKVTTFFGREGSGKSTVGDSILIECQRMGGISLKIDAEQRHTKDRFERMGGNSKDLIVIDGATLEGAFSAIDRIIDKVREQESAKPLVVVYDSVAGSVTEKRMQAEYGDKAVGEVARFLSEELKHLKVKLSRTGVALVLINQLRNRINTDDPRSAMYRERMKVLGTKSSMLGENALLYESALMVYMNSIGVTGDDRDHPDGISIRATIRKCGISPHESWKAEFDIDALGGIDYVGSAFNLLEEIGILKQSGGGYYMWRPSPNVEFDAAQKKFQRKDFAQILDDHPELRAIIKAAPELWQTS